MGKTRHSFEDVTEDERFVVGVSVEREMEETSMRTDSGEERIAPR